MQQQWCGQGVEHSVCEQGMHGALVSDCLFAHVQEQAHAGAAGAPTGCALRHVDCNRHGQQGHQGVCPPGMYMGRHMHGQQRHQTVRPQACALKQAEAAGAPRDAPFRHVHGHRDSRGIKGCAFQACALSGTCLDSRGTQGCALRHMPVSLHRHGHQGHQGLRPLDM
jgi:hypothetical protein